MNFALSAYTIIILCTLTSLDNEGQQGLCIYASEFMDFVPSKIYGQCSAALLVERIIVSSSRQNHAKDSGLARDSFTFGRVTYNRPSLFPPCGV